MINVENFLTVNNEQFITADNEELFVVSSTDEMSIDLYHNSAKLIKLDKTENLKFVGRIYGTFRDSFDLTNIELTISYPKNIDFNYVYIPNLDRYYVVDNVEYVNNVLKNVILSIDVLHTYKDDIRKLTGFVDRYENASGTTKLISDDMVVVYNGFDIKETVIDETIFGNDDEHQSFIVNGFALGLRSNK